MRHRVAGRKLGRTSSHRQALLRNQAASLIMSAGSSKERIKTTLPKAKELQRFAEKLVTLSKKETLHARRLAVQKVQDKRAVAKLFDTLSARYSQRPGGYTRIIKLGPRRGDNAELAMIEWVGGESVTAAQEPEEKPAKGKRAAGKAQAAKDKAPAKKAKTAKKKTKTTKATPARSASPKPAAKPAGRKAAPKATKKATAQRAKKG